MHSGNVSVGDWYGEEANLMMVNSAERERERENFGEPVNKKGGGMLEKHVVCMIVLAQ